MIIQTFVVMLFNILSFLILGRVLISWIDPMGNMRASQILRDLTEPILGPLRSIIPSVGMFDISPLIALLILQLIARVIMEAL